MNLFLLLIEACDQIIICIIGILHEQTMSHRMLRIADNSNECYPCEVYEVRQQLQRNRDGRFYFFKRFHICHYVATSLRISFDQQYSTS